jgi:hypothetical protein
MTNRLRYLPLCLLALTMVTSTASQAQQSYAAGNYQTVAAAPLPQDQLDALLAPIALYPDQLLAQVLMASTYPNDVANAARFVRENPSLNGAALDQALQGQNWDPSVLSLAAYPQVLLMMNDMLDWTQRLGNAFLANQQQVMDTVQMLRSRAQAAGHLQSTPQQTVIDQGGIIDIEPTQPGYVYVPVYDPTVTYGSWSEAYVPPYWYPPAIYGYPHLVPGIAAGIFFGTACRIDYNHWGWARPNWRGHDIDVNVSHNYFANRPQYADRWRDGRWAHSAEQRYRVGDRDNGSQWARPGNAAVQPRDQYRMRDTAQMQQAIARPAPQPRPFQQEIVRPAPQSRPFQQETARPAPQSRPFQQAIARPAPQPRPFQQEIARPAPQPPAFTRTPQLQQPIARVMPQPDQRIARPVQQPQQGAWRAPQQSMYPVAHPASRPQETIARPLPQQPSRQSMARETFQPPQSFARSMPPSRQIASPMAQPSVRSAPQIAYNQQPRAQIQMAANHDPARDAGRGEANRTMNSRPEKERGQR